MQALGSGFIHFAAMGNHMNRNVVLIRIGCVQDSPMSNPQLVQIREGACQRFRLDLIVMLGEPLDLFHNPFCNWGVELGKILKCLRRELDVIDQASFSLSLTSCREIRSVEPRDSWSLALISSVITKSLSGSVMMFCNSSCTTFLINACNSSTVRSAAFMWLSFSIICLTNRKRSHYIAWHKNNETLGK